MIKHRLLLKRKINEGLLLVLAPPRNSSKKYQKWEFNLSVFLLSKWIKEWTNSEGCFSNSYVNSNSFILLLQTVSEYPLLPGLRFPSASSWTGSGPFPACRLLCHTCQLSHFPAWAAECFSNTMIVHTHVSVCKLQTYNCILNGLFSRKGEKIIGGKLNNSYIDFITSSIKVTFTKWHLSLQTLSTLKFKGLICRRQNSST